MKVRICARPRGPLVVHLDGVDCELRDAEDRPIDVAGREKLLLCLSLRGVREPTPLRRLAQPDRLRGPQRNR